MLFRRMYVSVYIFAKRGNTCLTLKDYQKSIKGSNFEMMQNSITVAAEIVQKHICK